MSTYFHLIPSDICISIAYYLTIDYIFSLPIEISFDKYYYLLFNQKFLPNKWSLTSRDHFNRILNSYKRDMDIGGYNEGLVHMSCYLMRKEAQKFIDKETTTFNWAMENIFHCMKFDTPYNWTCP